MNSAICWFCLEKRHRPGPVRQGRRWYCQIVKGRSSLFQSEAYASDLIIRVLNAKACQDLNLQSFHVVGGFCILVVISCQMQDTMYNQMC